MFGKTSFALVVVVTVIIIITIKTTKDNVGTVAKSAEGMRSTECPPVANISQMRRARGGGGGSVFLPTSGRTSDVGGMFSATSIRKTVIDSSVVMPIDTFSPGRHGNDDDAHRHLLAGVARDVESEQRDERDDEARHDHVEDVEERLAAHAHGVRDVRVRLGAARVEPDVALDVHLHQRPLGVRDVVGRVAVVAHLLQVQLPINDNRRKTSTTAATSQAASPYGLLLPTE